ncbi:uncharacterized protein K460DRAFT_281341 [Cucurbitaria berberidis CBS 394.84]|uniref:DUF4604 domain-containing protein n=1 Tax=Cucurbitaria berberidis CBS 394.84 TaxID=1168544 RepID=A0A9P4LCH1_9PLEO|nr:uncharacterized protein K460DRAFT_281341 [Cucurbitaria berberidis CBS 394.84]KAF1849367.1 hypothetical protein K460DRAFT_281341 [Cucurbitaria berberidis CBS 394.84]
MSFKAKDLHFDNSQPAFLQRLRGQLAGGDSARHEQPILRNKRMKQDDDEDDAPTYVLEETNQSLTKEEYDALVSGKDNEEGEKSTGDGALKERVVEGDEKPKDKIVEVGVNAKKRKAAKIISDENEQSKEEDGKAVKKADGKVMKKTKKKAKAVKLTFGDEEEG